MTDKQATTQKEQPSAQNKTQAGTDSTQSKAAVTKAHPKFRLQDESINPFISETDPKNPYGPNYEELPYHTKVYYKFNRLKKFVHLEKEDSEKIMLFNMQFAFLALGGAAITSGFAYLMKRFLIKPNFGTFHEFLDRYSHVYYGVLIAGSTTAVYHYNSKHYIDQICQPFIDKYMAQALDNGFEDYKISTPEKFDVESLLREARKAPPKKQ